MALEVVQDSTEDSLINSIRSPIRLGANTIKKVTFVTFESLLGLGYEPGIFFVFQLFPHAILLSHSGYPAFVSTGVLYDIIVCISNLE
jgi:hypothetical protein